MMYNQKFVLALKSNGKILRENKDTVLIPFGSEFSVLLKNLNNVRAVVKVSIDGKDVLNGSSLVVNANSELNLERFLNDANEGRKFRFIERTTDIENHRGIGCEDGLVRVEVQYERPVVTWENYKSSFTPWIQPKWTFTPPPYFGPKYTCEPDYRPCGISDDGLVGSIFSSSNTSFTNDSFTANALNLNAAFANDVGITVEGSKSTQQFQNVSVGLLESETHVLILQMKGVIGEQCVEQPVTVKTKKLCSSCGRSWHFNMEYCPKDGTFLKVA